MNERPPHLAVCWSVRLIKQPTLAKDVHVGQIRTCFIHVRRAQMTSR